MHELAVRRARTHGRLSYELVHPYLFLVWSPVTEPFDGGPARGLHVVVNVSTDRVREACRRASPEKFEPVVSRMRWPRCDGQAARFVIIHGI
jgi:hypothetical protein